MVHGVYDTIFRQKHILVACVFREQIFTPNNFTKVSAENTKIMILKKIRHCRHVIWRHFVQVIHSATISSIFFAHQFQDFQEQVKDIQVEIDRSQDVFFGRQLMDDHVCVEYNKAGKQDGTHSCQSCINDITLNEKLERD